MTKKTPGHLSKPFVKSDQICVNIVLLPQEDHVRPIGLYGHLVRCTKFTRLCVHLMMASKSGA